MTLAWSPQAPSATVRPWCCCRSAHTRAESLPCRPSSATRLNRSVPPLNWENPMASLRTRFTDLVGIEFPIVQEGMGPFRTAKLAAAVSEAGGLGTVSIPGMTATPEEGARNMRAQIDTAMALTSRPFAVNVPVGVADSGEMLPVSAAYINAVLAARESDAAIARQLRVLTTSAGFPGLFRERIKASGLIHMHKVGSTRHARKAEAAGVDVVIASGYEMGGHTHASPVHTFVLVPNVTEKVRVPVLLSG